jgi:hypothetical protein
MGTLVACLICVLAGCGADAAGRGAVGTSGVGSGSPPPGPPVAASVSVSPQAPMTAVPRSYLGVSTEYWALPLWSGQMPLLERVLALLRVPGNGPFSLRIGGDSADHSFWDPHAAQVPRWAFSLAPQWLDQARALVRRLGVRLILDLNLITDTPAAAGAWARAAEAGLPRGSIAAFEVGNEPDLYTRAAWLAITAGKSPAGRSLTGRPLPAALTAADYVRDFGAYAEVLEQVAPRAGLAGPALANPNIHRHWTAALITGARRSLGLVTIHRYPYTACTRRHPRAAPTVTRLLSAGASGEMASALRPTIDLAHGAGLAVRLTELNSVTCGGRPGVSNTFATALWAPDALFNLLRAGIDGVNLHVRANTINAPFALTSAGLTPRPLLYGMILFARALGPQARLVASRVNAPAYTNFRAWVLRVGPNTLHVVLIDKGRRSMRVSLRLPTTATGAVQRLLAPSARSETGVTLGGRQLGANGHWQGLPTRESVSRRGGRYVIAVGRFSAVMLSLRVPPGALQATSTGARRPRAAGSAPRVAPSPPR